MIERHIPIRGFMKVISLGLLSLIVLSCSTKTKRMQKDFDKEFTVQEITDDTYVITDKQFYDSNILVAEMEDDTVFVASAPFETVGGERLLKWINLKLKPKKIIAVNTHFHADGTGANGAFKDGDVEIWASNLTNKLYQENALVSRQKEAKLFTNQPALQQRILDRPIIPAPHTFDEKEGKEFEFDGEKVQVIYPGPAHTKDNMVVYFPKRKVLYGSCMVRPGKSLGNLADADLDNWEKSISSIQGLDATIVIPGHGKVGGPELITQTINLVKNAVPEMSEEIIAQKEEELLTAMKNSDVPTLNTLLSDDLVFINQDGLKFSKVDDLEAHKLGVLKISELQPFDQQIKIYGDVAVVSVGITIAGNYSGHPFKDKYRYSRIWKSVNGKLQVVSAHCSEIKKH